MKQLEKFLSLPENRQVAQNASRRVLETMAPEKAALSAVFIEPLLDMVADGEISAIDTADEAGGFGAPDLIVMIVVPAVVSALATVMTRAGVQTLSGVKKEQIKENEKEIALQISEDIKIVVRIQKPSLSPRKLNKLVDQLQKAMMTYLLADDSPLQDDLVNEYLGPLRQQIDQLFNDSELQNLCLTVGVDYESLTGETKQDKVRQLILHCNRHGTIQTLIEACRQERPHITW